MALLTACAEPIAVQGPGTFPSALGGSGFVLASPSERGGPSSTSVRAAVEAALIERGFGPESDAHYRIDMAFAVAPTEVEVAEVDTAGTARPVFALCKRQRYVLSIAVLDRRDGRVVFRNRASAARCDRAAEDLVGALARAVVQGS